MGQTVIQQLPQLGFGQAATRIAGAQGGNHQLGQLRGFQLK